jgi:hypothetical protein
MAAKGRKQKACFLKQNLEETLEIHLTGKTTEKRQNFDSSTPPDCAEHLHLMLNRETRTASAPQMAWEDADHKVS